METIVCYAAYSQIEQIPLSNQVIYGWEKYMWLWDLLLKEINQSEYYTKVKMINSSRQ